MSVEPVRMRLARRGLAAHRSRGQNFLVDARVGERIAEAAGILPEETVLEIGTGLGLLTESLARRAARVVTIEIDAGLVAALRDEGELAPHVELVHADALALDLGAMLGDAPGGARLVANLPYAVSAPLLRRILAQRGVLRGWTVMVQREVAERLLAPPGCKAYGSLAVLHRLTTVVERLFDVAPRCFHPVPRVVSTLLRVTPLPAPGLPDPELAAVEPVVRAAFGQRRKTLANALRALPAAPAPEVLRGLLAQLGIAPNARAETVAPERFLALSRGLAAARRAP